MATVGGSLAGRAFQGAVCAVLATLGTASGAPADSGSRPVPELVAPPVDPLPVRIEAPPEGVGGGALRRDVFSEVDQSFDVAAAALTRPESWCRILSLHLNVKGCVHCDASGEHVLAVFVGRKFYQGPEQASRVDLQFAAAQGDADTVAVDLRADRGPMGSRNYALTVRAVPADDDRTSLRLHYANEYGLVARVAMFSYLRTLGRNKVGLRAVGRGPHGRPIYPRGLEGVIERNAMRYHLAMRAFLETLGLPDGERAARRDERWFALTEAYPQLHEMERDAYLEAKRRERANHDSLHRATCGSP